MGDNKVKVEYTAVPLEDPDKTSDSKKTEGKTHQKNDGLPTYFVNNSTHECYFRCHEKRKVWKKALISILVVFLVSKLLFGLHTFFVLNEFNDEEDQYLWVEVQEPGSSDVEAEGYASTFGYPSLPFPISQKCEPDIKWEGPNEILIDTKNTSGLIFKVKGLSARGSVTIRQDPRSRDFINVTNNIYIGDESLRERVDIKISYSDDDYLIVVETPSFFFPPKKGSCVLIDTIITIPYTVNVFRSLSIDAPNNWIRTDSLGSIDFAYVNLKTVNGHIRVDDLTSANADVSTVNGHVSGVFIVGENLEVRSVNGPVNINVIPNPFSDSIFAGVSSFNGNLNVEVDELMKYQKIELKGHTVNGGIIATMPKTYKGDFLVSSVTGYAYVEGKGITLRKDTHNLKEGYKGDGNKKHHCKHVKQNSNSLFDDRKSNLTLTVVTGASELYFD